MAAATTGDWGFGLSLGGTIGGAIGSIFEGQAQRDWYNTNAFLAETEGRIAGIGAKMNIKKFREQSDSFFKSQVALYAKAGVKLEGSPIAVLKASARDMEYDALVKEYDADFNQWEKSMQASMYRGYGASAARAGVANAVTSGVTGLGTLLMRR